MHNAVVPAPGAKECVVPGDCTDASIVAVQGFYKLASGRVPDLQGTSVSAHGEKMSITGPLDTSYAIGGPDIAQFCYLAIHG